MVGQVLVAVGLPSDGVRGWQHKLRGAAHGLCPEQTDCDEGSLAVPFTGFAAGGM
jgi:hypothetical protein